MLKSLHEKTIKPFFKPAQYLANIKTKKQDKNEAKSLYRTENREYKDSIWNMLGSFVGIGANGDYLGNIRNSIDTMREERADNTAARKGYYGALLDYGESYFTPAQGGKALDDAYNSYVAGDDGYLDYIWKNTSEGVNSVNNGTPQKKGAYGSALATIDTPSQEQLYTNQIHKARKLSGEVGGNGYTGNGYTGDGVVVDGYTGEVGGDGYTGNGVVTEEPMTYEQYIAEQKKLEEENYQTALKEAEAYRERAAVDANTSYLQNMSTYGVNAETLARMGLTGSGYSDYLNAQAYAQKRSDLQQAESNYLDMKDKAKTTYHDNLSAWDEKLATKQLTDQTYSDNAYNEVLSAVQNTYKYDQYTEDGIRALGEQYKWDEDKINGLIDTWKATAGVKNETTTSFYEDTLKLAQRGFKGTDAEAFSRDDIYEMLLQARTDGDVTNEEVTSIMEAYDVWNLYNNLEIDVDTYYDYLSGDEAAKENAKIKIAEAQNKTNTEGVKEKVDEYLKNKGIESTGDVVSIYSKNFDVSQFGDFGNSGGKQEKYINAVIDMAKNKNNQLKEGDIVSMNYGARALNNAEKGNWKLEHNYGMYVYAGNGQFGKLSDAAAAKVDSKDITLPDGYHIGWFGTIRDD